MLAPARPTLSRAGATALLAATVSLTVSACAAQQPRGQQLSGEEGRVQDVVERFATRAGDDNAGAICTDSLAPETARKLARGGDCTANVRTLIAQTDVTTLPVDSVRIEGNTAVVTITREQRATAQTKLVLTRAASGQPWKIAAFGNDAARRAIGTTPGTTPVKTPAR